MAKYLDTTKKAEINIRLSEFEMPPMQDVLIVGKRAPIGAEGARRMVDILSPDQYDIIKIEHDTIEAIVVRRTLLKMLPKDKLVNLILEEGGKIANESIILKMQINITIQVSRSIDI
ncbi:hypothetical protein FQB35_02050 [Crassaminicella thermophila]|uniref:Uncharacterized protein n=1 Tax=Crassaminicella thermophila TaxID=2599308 RepID=A0A5C0SBF7_CRATE|nr:hypothetical protein [Crassaminicella thermophila]QEK11247.1 hypothetical protein FQB35_02050 [Crassaminicella thermophila]